MPGIDAILVGHAHVEIPQRFVTNKATGKQVVLTEPLYWGMRLSLIELDLDAGHGAAAGRSSRPSLAGAELQHRARGPEDRRAAQGRPRQGGRLRQLGDRHVHGGDVGGRPRVTRTPPALDFINYVQADAVKKALAGTADADLPVLSIAAPFNRDARDPGRSRCRSATSPACTSTTTRCSR